MQHSLLIKYLNWFSWVFFMFTISLGCENYLIWNSSYDEFICEWETPQTHGTRNKMSQCWVAKCQRLRQIMHKRYPVFRLWKALPNQHCVCGRNAKWNRNKRLLITRKSSFLLVTMFHKYQEGSDDWTFWILFGFHLFLRTNMGR